MRVLVTGASGFVGSYLVPLLRSEGHEVFSAALPPADINLDISSVDSCREVLKQTTPEVIYHLAGLAFVPAAEANFLSALTVNVLGTSNLYKANSELGLNSAVILISSGEVYGRVSESRLPITEETSISPANNYSLSKAMAELVTRRYEGQGIRSVIMRPFNHIGAGQSEMFVVSSFARQLAEVATKKRPPIIMVGNLEARRDFTDVRDIVRGYVLAAAKGEGVYNLCSGKSISIAEILQTLLEISGLKVDIREDPERKRKGEVLEVRGSFDKAKRELGWEPVHGVRGALESCYQNWLNICSG